MSVISNVHSVVPFDSKTSKAFDGQRLIKVIYKTVRKGENAGTRKDSKCVSIPADVVLDDDTYSAFEPHILSLYKDTQDSIIRYLVDAGATEIQDAQIDSKAVLLWLEEEAKGNRLTREAVTIWFNASMADLLTVAFGDKLGVSDTPTESQVKQIDVAVGVYRDKFAGLAGGKTSYDKETSVKLLKVLELVEENEITAKFQKRLEGMRDAPTGADMFGL